MLRWYALIERGPTVDLGLLLDSDILFHLHIAQAARNEIFVFMPAVRLRAIAGHEQILRALQGRDPDAARAAMKEHLENVQKWAEDAAGVHAEDARPGGAAPRESDST
jgi:DNA-binding FadR family transcriptional regulator